MIQDNGESSSSAAGTELELKSVKFVPRTSVEGDALSSDGSVHSPRGNLQRHASSSLDYATTEHTKKLSILDHRKHSSERRTKRNPSHKGSSTSSGKRKLRTLVDSPFATSMFDMKDESSKKKVHPLTVFWYMFVLFGFGYFIVFGMCYAFDGNCDF